MSLTRKPTALINQADQALYAGKRGGRNRVLVSQEGGIGKRGVMGSSRSPILSPDSWLMLQAHSPVINGQNSLRNI